MSAEHWEVIRGALIFLCGLAVGAGYMGITRR